jgi:hypothetical protein
MYVGIELDLACGGIQFDAHFLIPGSEQNVNLKNGAGSDRARMRQRPERRAGHSRRALSHLLPIGAPGRGRRRSEIKEGNNIVVGTASP